MVDPFGVCILEEIEGHLHEGERGPSWTTEEQNSIVKRGSEVEVGM